MNMMILMGKGFTRDGGASELTGDTKVNGPKGVLPDVLPPPVGRTYGPLHERYLPLFNIARFLQGSLVDILIPLCKDLDDGGGVITVLEEGIDVVRQAELFPTDPMRIRCFGTFSSDPKSGIFLENAKISVESVSLPCDGGCVVREVVDRM
jgi:hypothetical protein